MQKNTLRKRAAAVQAAARGRPVFVFAAHPDDAVDSAALENAITASTYAPHTCSTCGTTSLVTAALKAPMCVCCGTITKATAAATELSATRKTEVKAGALQGVQCVHCSTINVMPKGVVASGSIHCSTCGEGIQANAVSPDNGGDPVKVANNNPQTMTQDFKLPTVNADADGDFDATDIEEVDDVVMGSDEDDFDLADDGALDDVQAKRIFASLMDDDGANGVQGADDDGFDPLADIQVPPATATDFVDTEGFGLTAATEDEDEDEDEDGDEEEAKKACSSATPDLVDDTGLGDNGLNLNPDGTVSVTPQPGAALREFVPNDLEYASLEDGADDFEELPVYEGEGEPIMACAGFDNTTKALSFASVGTRLVAMKGHTAIAVLQPKRAKQNASVMHTEAFAQAVMTIANRSGLDKALAHFNFDHIKVPSVATTRTERQIAAFKQQAAAKEEAANKVRAECFAIAAAGLAAGKFRSEKSALSTGLRTELKRLGVRNPAPIVASLMRQHGMAYAEQLVRVAAKLGNMNTASRKELADMFDLVEDDGDDLMVAETQESLDRDNDGDVDGDDFAMADAQRADEFVTSSLLQPGRVARNYVSAGTHQFDAAAEARAILEGRAPVFS